MKPAEAAQLLAYTAAVDPRFNTTDAEQAAARVVAWADVLDDVPAKYAATFVRRAYRTERRWPLQPGEIRDAWLDEQRRVEASRRVIAPAGVPMPDSVRQLRDQLRDARIAREGTLADP